MKKKPNLLKEHSEKTRAISIAFDAFYKLSIVAQSGNDSVMAIFSHRKPLAKALGKDYFYAKPSQKRNPLACQFVILTKTVIHKIRRTDRTESEEGWRAIICNALLQKNLSKKKLAKFCRIVTSLYCSKGRKQTLTAHLTKVAA